ncbi:retrovirus-related Pol polyprotein from transposon opus [Trichonephila clavata]|uniref:Retrovirus-related Pol polyprotein from transposon opus n=1 Tax=Trichonephila clavata TaxID=2740835 RepID=A0A8X6I9H0_TRICU|nr:retrovirus-related Pol polyprotein from transposon opus [Trichonephila clavata]
MAFLGKGLKADLQIMATEMGVEYVLSLKVFELREAILNSKNFDEEFCREQLNTIIEKRKRREEIDLAERKRKEDMERTRLDEFEERKRKDEMDFELQKKRIELKGGGSENEVKESGQFKIDLHKLLPKEIPHALTGVSPYQLVYGRLPSGPMTILKEFWTGEREIPTNAARSVEEYLKQLYKKLQYAHEITSENSAKNH